MRLRIWLPLLALLATGSVLVWHLYSRPTESAGQPGRQVPVRSTLVEATRAEPRLRLSGTLEANHSVVISPEVTGRILDIPVQAGQQVAAGAVLVRLDAQKQQAERAELAASLRDEERKLRDMRRLVSRGAVTQSELEGQEASVAMARARLDGADYELSLRTLIAPFAGTVSLIDLSRGALVSSGATLLHLDDLQTLRLDLAVPERYLAMLQRGMAVEASSSAWPDEQFKGEVSAVDSRVSEGSQNIRVRIQISNPDARLKPGMLLEVALALPAREVTRIPSQAVEYAGAERFVYRLEADGKVRRIPVQLGELHGETVWILTGLSAGERVIVEGLVNLRDGVSVRDLAQEKS